MSPALPESLSKEKFALLVSTIEPRKGHSLLAQVWRRLALDGVPQKYGFKLVFAGRRGWMVDDLLSDLAKDLLLVENIVVLNDVNDELLTALYENAAFCVYPSMYEGYGLPVVEAFSHGKAVIASTGGALPEVVEGLSPCLDPTDDEGWYKSLKSWIEDPECRRSYERDIAAKFHHPNWSEVAAGFFATVRQIQR